MKEDEKEEKEEREEEERRKERRRSSCCCCLPDAPDLSLALSLSFTFFSFCRLSERDFFSTGNRRF